MAPIKGHGGWHLYPARSQNRITPLGEVEEAFAATLTPGDTFLIGGQVVRFEGLRELVVEVSKRASKEPKIAVFGGTKFATSTQLSERILHKFETGDFRGLPDYTTDWLELQKTMSVLPQRQSLLIETFPRHDRHHLCVFGFAGRNAQQTCNTNLGVGPCARSGDIIRPAKTGRWV